MVTIRSALALTVVIHSRETVSFACTASTTILLHQQTHI